MLTKFFFAVCIVVLRENVLGGYLGCHHCPRLLVYNYIMTAESIPSDFLRDCSFLMSQKSCTIDLEIDLDSDKPQTIMYVTSSMEYVETSIEAIATIVDGLKHKRHVSFWCSDPHGGCNNEDYLKRVLQSVSIEGSFEELEHLLNPTNQTIDNSSCVVFSNTTTTECQSESSDDDNKSCYIESLTDVEKSFEVCAHCSSTDDYYLIYSMKFFINNLSIPQSDNRRLSCAVPQCNSVANLERIGQLVTIDFNETIFFDTSTTTILPTTTATSMSSVSIVWVNNSCKYYTVFILIVTLFGYNIVFS